MEKITEEVRYKDCGEPIDESLDPSPRERKSCSKCGSTKRAFAVCIETKVILREKALKKARRGDTGKPYFESVAGDDLYRKSSKWMLLERIIDREKDFNKEVISDPKTGKIIRKCEEPLSQHIGHGSAR